MAAGRSVYDQMYRVMGASRAAAANRRVAQSNQRLAQATRAASSGLLGMRSALSGNMLAVAAGALAIRRAVTEYERYTIAISRVNTTLAAQTVNHRQNTRLTTTLAESVGRDLGYSLTESNEAMEVMLQTGLGVHKSM